MKFTITIDADTHDDASQVEHLFSALAAVSAPNRKVTLGPVADPVASPDRADALVYSTAEQAAPTAPVDQDFLKGYTPSTPVTEPGPSDNIGTLTVHSMTGAVPVAPVDHAAMVAPVEQAALVAPVEQAAPVEQTIAHDPILDQPADDRVYLTGEFDNNGLPWDARIHASTKTKNADDSWRNRRGVDKELIAQIEAELKAGTAPVTAPPVPFVAAPVAPAVDVDVMEERTRAALEYATPAGAPMLQPAAAPVDVAPPTTGAAPMSYADFMTNLSVAVRTKGLTTDHIKAMCAAIGVPDVMTLGTRLELIPTAVAYLDAIEVE